MLEAREILFSYILGVHQPFPFIHYILILLLQKKLRGYIYITTIEVHEQNKNLMQQILIKKQY